MGKGKQKAISEDGGRVLNPADRQRKKERQKEKEKNKKRREEKRAVGQQKRVAETIREELHQLERDEKLGSVEVSAATLRKKELRDEFEKLVSVHNPKEIKDVIKQLPTKHAAAAHQKVTSTEAPALAKMIVQPPPSIKHHVQLNNAQYQTPMGLPNMGMSAPNMGMSGYNASSTGGSSAPLYPTSFPPPPSTNPGSLPPPPLESFPPPPNSEGAVGPYDSDLPPPPLPEEEFQPPPLPEAPPPTLPQSYPIPNPNFLPPGMGHFPTAQFRQNGPPFIQNGPPFLQNGPPPMSYPQMGNNAVPPRAPYNLPPQFSQGPPNPQAFAQNPWNPSLGPPPGMIMTRPPPQQLQTPQVDPFLPNPNPKDQVPIPSPTPVVPAPALPEPTQPIKFGGNLIPAALRVKRTMANQGKGPVAKKPRLDPVSNPSSTPTLVPMSQVGVSTPSSSGAATNAAALDDEFESYMNEMKALGAI